MSRPIGVLVILVVTLGLGSITEGGLSVSLLTLAILAACCLASHTLITAIKGA